MAIETYSYGPYKRPSETKKAIKCLMEFVADRKTIRLPIPDREYGVQFLFAGDVRLANYFDVIENEYLYRADIGVETE